MNPTVMFAEEPGATAQGSTVQGQTVRYFKVPCEADVRKRRRRSQTSVAVGVVGHVEAWASCDKVLKGEMHWGRGGKGEHSSKDDKHG